MPRQFLLQILFVLASLYSGKSFAQSGPAYLTIPDCESSGCASKNGRCINFGSQNSGSNENSDKATIYCVSNGTPPPAKEAPQVNSSNSKDNCLSLISQMGACYGASQEASTSCKEENDSELQATVRSIRDTTAQADQVLSATGLNGGCGVVLKATNTMAGAYASFSQTCNAKISKCVSTCEDVQNKYNTYSCDLYEESRNSAQAARLTGSLQACQSLTLQANQGAQFQNSLPDLANQAAACKAALSAPDASLCAQNPTASICGGSSATDCTDPAMASTTICACKGGINTTALR